MRAFIADWRKKSQKIATKLEADGHVITDDPANSDIQLIDHDLESHVSRQSLGDVSNNVWMYPHGAGAIVPTAWDGVCNVWSALRGTMVNSWGQKLVYDSYGYSIPTYVVGWTFCDVVDRYEPTKHIEKVLFAPHHPPYIHGREKIVELNNTVLSQLVKRGNDYCITLRHIYSLNENGLPNDLDGITFVREGREDDFDEQLAMIDDADVVVTTDAGTFPHLAIARGKPVVMAMSTDTSTIGGSMTEHLSQYIDYIEYPFDIATYRYDVWQLIEAAAHDVDVHSAWKDRYIGSNDLDLTCLYESID